MNLIKKIVEWAVILGRLVRQPVTLPKKPKGFDKTQEMARRRRQMSKYGAQYWYSIWEGPDG